MLHKGGGLPAPWLFDQPEHVIAELVRQTNAILDDIQSDAD